MNLISIRNFLLLTIFLVSAIGKAQVTIWTDDFESDNGWSGTGWTRDNSSFTGSDGAHYRLTQFANYTINQSLRVTSPSIDLSGYENLELSIDVRYDTEVRYDGFNIEYSSNGGASWILLGNSGSGTNWYNRATVDALSQSGWTGDNSSWTTATIPLPTVLNDNSNAVFRVRFASDFIQNDRGVAFDNIEIRGTEKPVINTYTTSGSFTVPTGVTSIIVECWGAGGAGGGSRSNNSGGSGGGGGGYTQGTLAVTPGQVIPYTVGTGGTGVNRGNGSNGSATTFLSLTANGGTGGRRDQGNPGVGGTGVGGTINTTGANGTRGNTRGQVGGAGANGGAGGARIRNGNGNAGTTPGGAGGGSENNNTRGGNGADGQVTISYVLPTSITYYSQSSGNPTVLSNWNTQADGSGAAPLNFTTDDQLFVIQNGHTMTTTSPWTISGLATELQINSGATLVANRRITLSANTTFTINNGATYQHNNINNAIWAGTEVIGATSTVSYGFAGNQNVLGVAYGNLTILNGGNKTLTGDVAINGTLNLSGADLVLGTNNLTIADGANISGVYTNTNKIVTNSSGQLIKQGNNQSDFAMIYPVGTGSNYTPYQITALSSFGTGTVAVRAVSGVAPGPPAADSKDLNKYWEITETGLTITNANVAFTYTNAEVGTGGNQAHYSLEAYTAGAWMTPAITSVQGVNPMTASDLTDINGIWTARENPPVITYYSYRSGDWNSVSTWTHDPGGTTQTATSIPGNNAKVVILGGRTVTLNADVTNSDLSIAIMSGAFLNLSNYQITQTVAELNGQGTLKLSSSNFPSVTDNFLVATGGGTVEYNNTSNFNLPSAQLQYNNLVINSVARATQLHDINILSNLSIKQGVYRINNASSNRRKLTIEGNLTVDAGASLTTGTGNTVTSDVTGGTAPFTDYYDRNTHRVVINGDFINNGTVRFTNQAYPEYNSFPANGAATVYFRGVTDNNLTCNGQTDFYNIVLDKGSDQTIKLNLYSSAYQNFRLFGRNSYGGEVWGANPTLRKALWIRTGTLVLQGLTIIPSLTEGGDGGTPNSDYYIPANGGLILDGPDVVVLTTADAYQQVNAAYGVSGGTGAVHGVNNSDANAQSLSIFGKLQINDGYLSTRESGGIITWDLVSAEFIINGGEVDVKQFRAAGGASGLASYTQNGGTVTLRGRLQRNASATTVSDIINAPLVTTYSYTGISDTQGSLNLNNVDNVFTMTDGVIKVLDVCGSTNDYAIDIFSAQKNINVTGGTVELSPQTGSDRFVIRSAAPFGNLTINRAAGSTSEIHLASKAPEVSGALTVLGNLKLETGVLNANNFNLSIGGSFSLASGTTYTAGNNRTEFNGTSDQKLIMDQSGILSLNKLVVNKTSGELLLEGTQNTLNVTDSLIIEQGNLNCDTKNITARGHIYNAGKQLGTGAGRISMLGSATQNISGDGNGEFYYLRLNNSAADVTLTSDATITGQLNFSRDRLLDIATNQLTIKAGATVTGTNTSRYIKTAGNAGDKGVTIEYNGIAPKTFPVGVDSYAPATIGFTSAPSTYGQITVVPVNYEHPTTTTDNQALQYFWRVKSNGFTGISGKVTHQFIYSDGHIRGNENNYLPARYDVHTYGWDTGVRANVDQVNNTINDWTGSENAIDGDYTAGLNAAFGTPQKFYSRRTGLWSNRGTWSTASHTGASASRVPGAGDIVIIGNGHTVNMERYNNTPNRDAHSCASLQIETGATLDVTYNPSSDFGMVTSHPSGNGSIRISTTYNSGGIFEFPSGDFTDFNNNSGTTELYTTNSGSGTTYYLPDGVTEYGNLTISPVGGSNIIFSNEDITINGNLTTYGTDAGSWYCPTWNNNYPVGFRNRTRQPKTITIKGNFDIEGGSLVWYGNGAIRQDIIVEGDVIVANGSGIGSDLATNQSLSIGGSLINNSSADIHIGGQVGCNFSNIPLTFFGSGNAKITSTGGTPSTTIETIALNKGTTQASTLTMDIGGTVTYDSNNWLTLQNGTFIYNKNVNVYLSTNRSFTVPQTAGLTINSNRTFYLCAGNDDAYDLYLDGKLTILRGNLNLGNTANNNNNDIEYSGSGQSTIDIQGGNLFVNGQIRRNPASSAGILNYKQDGGETTINGRKALTSNAKFEVLNAGSSFEMSGGKITIVRGGGINYGDLYLRPENTNITGGEILFNNTGVGAQNYSMDADISLNSLTITGGGSNAQLTLMTSPLVLKADLTLSNARSILDANATHNVPVTINGNLNNSGTYRYHQNTTTFSGVSQVVTGSAAVEFYNLNVNPLTDLTLSKDISILNTLTLSGGTLILGTHTAYTKGDVINNAQYTSSGNGLVLDGLAMQQVSGTGTFDRLELNNINGVSLLNDISIQGELAMTNGVLNIKNYLLSLGETATITGTFGVNNMITTNGVYSNKGIEKVMPVGDSPAFTFPLGVSGKYTPAILDLSASTSVATVRVHPVNSAHPATIDPSNVLKYFWAVESVGLNAVGGTMQLSYVDGDVQGDEANYYAARLLVPGTSWTKSNSVDEATNTISYTLSGNNISGEYSAGLQLAFPTNVPEYTTVNASGLWSDPSNWLQTAGDPYTLTGGPNGFIVVVDKEVTLDQNFAQAYKLQIESTGKLKVDNVHYGHIFGEVSGSGTLYLEDGQLPEGDYTNFLGCSNNSTLEFGGTTDYAIVGGLLNNAAKLVFSGTGRRTLPDADLTVCSQLLLDGPILDNSVYNRALYIGGSFNRISGSFLSGSGTTATVSFIGTAEQHIGGFVGANSTLNNLEINNAAGLTLDGDVEIAGNLLLTNGIINTSAVNTLTITNTAINCVTPAGGKGSSYINGPLTKRMNQSDSFKFPIGKSGESGSILEISAVTTGTKLWTAEYHRPNPTSANYSLPLTAINTREFWSISTPGGGQAKVQLGWSASSDITPVVTEHGLSDIRLVNYDGSAWQEIVSVASGTDASGIVVATNRINVSAVGTDFTTATLNTNKPKVRLNPAAAICDLATGINVDLVSTVPTTATYELSYTIDGVAQTPVTVNSFPYNLATPSIGVYTLTEFKYNNKSLTGVIDVTPVTVFATPTTANAGADQALQGLSQATLDANVAVVGVGQWSIVSGTGGGFVDPTNPKTVFNGTNGSSYDLRWTIVNGDCESADEVHISFPILPPFTWLGNTNDWYDATNWAGGAIPVLTSEVTIEPSSNNPVIDPAMGAGIAQSNDLTIKAGATLTLMPGAKVTINGNLVTNDALTINNTPANPASLITEGTVIGETTFNWMSLSDKHWWHVGHPVTGVTQSEYDASLGVDRYALNRYTNAWDRVAGKDNSYSDSYLFDDPLEGYSLYVGDPSVTLSYAGILNNDASYAKSGLSAKWHKIANPYPCYIDAEQVGFDLDNFLKTVYIDAYDDKVVTFNTLTNIGVNGGSRYIAPGQAMWLRTYRASNLAISKSARTHAAISLKSAPVKEDNILRLQLKSSVATDETVIAFGADGVEEFSKFDSEKKMNGGKIASIYSVKEGKASVISYLPELSTERVVQLGYQVSKKGMEAFTIKASNIRKFLPETTVYLVDKLKNIKVNLREEQVYTFTPQQTKTNDRFELVFEEPITTDVNNKVEALEKNVKIYAIKDKAIVKVSSEILKSKDRVIELYDLSGQLISQHEVNSTTTQFTLPKNFTMYIIKVSVDNASFQGKVVSQM